MIVDPGARTNLLGSDLARRLANRALETGHMLEQGKLKNPLTIQGVGNGYQECNWEMNCPIVVPQRGGSAKLHHLRSPIVEGTGSHLPGLLGLDTLEAQGAILDMGRKMLIFPGSGEVKMELPPGSLEIPLQKSPSGHLVMVIDDFENLTKKGGVPDVPLQLHTSNAPQETAASPPMSKI